MNASGFGQQALSRLNNLASSVEYAPACIHSGSALPSLRKMLSRAQYKCDYKEPQYPS